MDRITRKDLKTDKFAEEVVDVFDWTSAHRGEVIRYGSIVVVVILIAVGVMYYNRHEAGVRQDALADMLRIDDATVGVNNTAMNLHFDTQAEKDAARTKAFTEVASKYEGTQEGAIAAMNLGSDAADKGNLAEAEKRFKSVSDTAPKPYAALARVALAQVYAAEGKTADAQKTLQQVIDNPTATVSKEQATIALAQVLAQSNPAQARKLLEPLRASTRSSVSQAAITAYGALPQTGQ